MWKNNTLHLVESQFGRTGNTLIERPNQNEWRRLPAKIKQMRFHQAAHCVNLISIFITIKIYQGFGRKYWTTFDFFPFARSLSTAPIQTRIRFQNSSYSMKENDLLRHFEKRIVMFEMRPRLHKNFTIYMNFVSLDTTDPGSHNNTFLTPHVVHWVPERELISKSCLKPLWVRGSKLIFFSLN
jgi:hypothetical protein